MLTVIIDARAADPGLPGLLAQLTAGAVDGIVRQVLIVAADGQAGIDALCEETGAEPHATLAAAAGAARAEWLMILPPDLRLRDGWIGALNAHAAAGATPAIVAGLGEGGLLGRGPFGVLVERARVAGAQQAVDIKGLRRQLGLRARRIG